MQLCIFLYCTSDLCFFVPNVRSRVLCCSCTTKPLCATCSKCCCTMRACAKWAATPCSSWGTTAAEKSTCSMLGQATINSSNTTSADHRHTMQYGLHGVHRSHSALS